MDNANSSGVDISSAQTSNTVPEGVIRKIYDKVVSKENDKSYAYTRTIGLKLSPNERLYLTPCEHNIQGRLKLSLKPPFKDKSEWKTCALYAVYKYTTTEHIVIIEITLHNDQQFLLYIDSMLNTIKYESNVPLDIKTLVEYTKVFLIDNNLSLVSSDNQYYFTHKKIQSFGECNFLENTKHPYEFSLYAQASSLYLKLEKGEVLDFSLSALKNFNILLENYNKDLYCYTKNWLVSHIQEVIPKSQILRMYIQLNNGVNVYADIHMVSKWVILRYKEYSVLDITAMIQDLQNCLRANGLIVMQLNHCALQDKSVSIVKERISLDLDSKCFLRLSKIVNIKDNAHKDHQRISYKRIKRWKFCTVDYSSWYRLSIRITLFNDQTIFVTFYQDASRIYMVCTYCDAVFTLNRDEMQEDMKRFLQANLCLYVTDSKKFLMVPKRVKRTRGELEKFRITKNRISDTKCKDDELFIQEGDVVLDASDTTITVRKGEITVILNKPNTKYNLTSNTKISATNRMSALQQNKEFSVSSETTSAEATLTAQEKTASSANDNASKGTVTEITTSAEATLTAQEKTVSSVNDNASKGKITEITTSAEATLTAQEKTASSVNDNASKGTVTEITTSAEATLGLQSVHKIS